MTKSENRVKLIGIVQCDFAKERCSGFGCVNSFTERVDGFARYPAGEGIMVVPYNCGGCPGRRNSRVVSNLIKRAERQAGIKKEEIVVHLATCIVTDNGHYPPCPHVDYIETILRRKGLKVLKGTYRSKTATRRRAEGRYEPFDFDDD